MSFGTRIYSLITILFQLFFFRVAVGQQVEVQGDFFLDSARVGEEIRYSLSARYPRQLVVIFPDSNTTFAPFEFVKKTYFTTKTKDSLSYDSVIYHVKTFSLEDRQTLALPVYVIHEADCTLIWPVPDTIQFKTSLPAELDTISYNNLPLLESVEYHPVKHSLNYPLILSISGIVLCISIIGLILFGPSLKRHFILKRLTRNYNQFILTYQSRLAALNQTSTPELAESTVSLWKKYMEDLERVPFTKLTTKEIVNLVKDEALTVHLKTIDRSIYGGQQVRQESFESLQRFAKEKFNQKLEEVKHG